MAEEQWHCDEFCTHEDVVGKLQKQQISDEKVRQMAELFKILGDNTRIRLLYYLLQEDLCVCDLTVLAGSTQSAVSHQLRVLRNMRIVEGRKEGQRVIYSLCNDHVRQLLLEALAL